MVNPDSFRCLVAMIVLSAIGNNVLVIQPLAVGAMVDLLGFSERQAGLVVFTEVGSFSAGNLVMSGLIHRLNRRWVAYTGIALLVVGGVVSFIPKTFLPFLAVRSIPGFGCGLVIAAFVSTAALTRLPDKVFGLVNAFSIAYSAALLTIAPALIVNKGLLGMYLAMAVGAVLCSGMTQWIPARPMIDATDRRSALVVHGQGKRHLALLTMVLLAMFLLYLGHGAVWAFQERMGTAVGIGSQAIGQILGASLLLGIAGSLVAWWAGLAIGRQWPQIISLGMSVAVAVLLVYTQSVAGFAIASGLVALSWFYGLPYQMGLLAQLDMRGRANVAGIIMTTGGAAVGPAVAGFISVPGDYAIIGWLAGTCYVLCLALFVPVTALLARQERHTTP